MEVILIAEKKIWRLFEMPVLLWGTVRYIWNVQRNIKMQRQPEIRLHKLFTI